MVVGPPRSATSAAKPGLAPLAKEPLTSAAELEERVHLSFSISSNTFEDLERAKAILSRKLPKGVSLEQALEELVEFFLKHKEPRKRKKPTRDSDSRHIPAAIRDEVFLRDEGRCTFRGPTGQRCGSRHDLQVDHIEPFALGGKHEVENLRVLCAKHNRLRAKQTFGELAGGGDRQRSLPHRNSVEDSLRGVESG